MERVDAGAGMPELMLLWKEAQGVAGKDAFVRDWLSRRIFRRMLDLDPGAAWIWIKSLDDLVPRMAFLSEWGARDAAGAVKAVRKAAGDDQTHFDLTFLARAMAQKNPGEFLRKGPPADWGMKSHEVEGFQQIALLALMEQDLTQAVTLAPKYLTGDTYVVAAMIQKMAERMVADQGLKEAMDWLKAMKDYPETLRQKLMGRLLPLLARENPEQAAEEFTAIASRNTAEAAGSIAALWAKKDPAAALRWASALPETGFGNNASQESALAKIGEVIGPDAPALLRAVADLRQQEGRFGPQIMGRQLAGLFAGLELKDAGPLLARLAAAPASANQKELVTACVLQWGRQDALSALRGMAELPESFAGPAREMLLSNFSYSGVAEFSDDETREFVRMVNTDPKLAGFVNSSNYAELLGRIAGKEPLEAMALLNSVTPETAAAAREQAGTDPFFSTRDSPWLKIFSSWAESNPQAAAAQVAALPEGTRQTAVQGLVQGWVAFDPMAASVWAGSLPSGTVRDAAAASLAEKLIPVEPSSAFFWAVNLSDEARRTPILEKALKAWIGEDPAVARQAVESSTLPEASRAACLKLFPEAKP